MSNEKRFGEQWDSYAKIIPADADPIQIQETRRAFYAGGTAFFRAMMSILGDHTGEATDQELQDINALKAELAAFGLDMSEGRA